MPERHRRAPAAPASRGGAALPASGRPSMERLSRLVALVLTISACAGAPVPPLDGEDLEAVELPRAPVTAGAAVDRDVVVAPDGSRVAFVSDRGGALGLWTAPLAGGGATLLTGGHDFLTAPAWSPDGSRLAYVSGREGPADLWIVPAAGGEPARMTSGPAACAIRSGLPTGPPFSIRATSKGGSISGRRRRAVTARRSG